MVCYWEFIKINSKKGYVTPYSDLSSALLEGKGGTFNGKAKKIEINSVIPEKGCGCFLVIQGPLKNNFISTNLFLREP